MRVKTTIRAALLGGIDRWTLLIPVLCVSIAGAETATWQGTSQGAWEIETNWDTGTVPNAMTDVRFETTSASTVLATTALPPFATLFVGGKGVDFSLGDAAEMQVVGAVTNYNSTIYRGGSYTFGNELVIGRSRNWPGSAFSYSTRGKFANCRAEIAGRVFVTGYSGNGLDVGAGAFVESAGYLDSLGTRNQTKIHDGGVFVSTGNMEISYCWPNVSFPEPFTVDGGTVTNVGNFRIAGANAGNVAVYLRNGSTWVQQGTTQIGCVMDANSTSNALQVCSGSRYLASAGDISIATVERTSKCFLSVDGGSVLEAGRVSIGDANRSTNSWMTVSRNSTATLTGLSIGSKYRGFRQMLCVTGGSTFTAKSLQVGGNGQYSDELGIAVSNSQFSIEGAVRLPQDVTCGKTSFTLSGTPEAPASASFPGGLVIGAAGAASGVQRTVPTVFTVEGGVVTCGKSHADGTTDGDVRLGALDVGGVSDLATNQLVIAGTGGCFIARHRMMVAGSQEIHFIVPDGGYRGEQDCGFLGKNAYLKAATVVMDVTQVKTDGTYTLAKAGYALELSPEKFSVVARGNQFVKVNYQNTASGRFLSVTVKGRRGTVLYLR